MSQAEEVSNIALLMFRKMEVPIMTGCAEPQVNFVCYLKY